MCACLWVCSLRVSASLSMVLPAVPSINVFSCPPLFSLSLSSVIRSKCQTHANLCNIHFFLVFFF
ncbi:Uncharacterized protein APZ42_029305 [Daphnia magna]|uniref:Secreted protein n=1 Tax=Daphnia magna TaxID=35525 RepID=A0A164PTA2_9CRUS|nr:Uncharacterized protein APZ42_029305 [Daphnia magna]